MTARANNRQEKAPLERGNFSADNNQHIANDTVDSSGDKAFATWQARYALHGHCLYRTVGTDGVTLYVVGKWNLFRELRGLEAVAAFFAMIGGTL